MLVAEKPYNVFAQKRIMQSIFIYIATITALMKSTSQVPVSSVPSSDTSKRLVCYYTFPSNSYNLQPNHVDANLCTHIAIGFVTVENSTVTIDEDRKKIIEEIIQLKKKNTKLKVMLSIGGGGGTAGFPEMASNNISRMRFINSFEKVIDTLSLDGIDLDWEFPNNILNNDKKHFIELLEDIRQSINNSVRNYLLSVAVAAPITIVELSYGVPEIDRLVDFVNLMSYDYNFFSVLTPWTGMNAPLYPRSADFFYFKTQNINFSSNYWVNKGLRKEKLNIGLPVYAHTYKLASPKRTYLGAPAVGDGDLGGGGSAPYGTVCEFIQNQDLKPVFDEETKSPYVTNGTEWVSYENDMSIKYKTEFIRDNDFGGVMVYSLSSDDYAGRCNNGKTFPNTKLIKQIFLK